MKGQQKKHCTVTLVMTGKEARHLKYILKYYGASLDCKERRKVFDNTYALLNSMDLT